MDYLKEAEAIAEKVISYRRHFHQYPESSGQEFRTAEKVAEILQALGLEVTTGVGHPLPGVVGLLRGGKPGPTVALRADMDGLRQQEMRESPYKSRCLGVMHGCGHDGHMAIQLGAAHLLSQHRRDLAGNVKFIFQPSEEMNGGAQPMIRQGVLENPKVDAIFALHVDSSFRTGEIALSYGETMAASDRLILKIKGRSAHGAYPDQGKDAIVMACQVILALQSLIAREKDTFQPAILSFGTIEGGKQPNVICEEVVLRGILRTLNPQTREMLIQRLEEILAGITKSFWGGYELIRERSYDSLINHNDMVDFQKSLAVKLVGQQSVKALPRARMIVEDFAYYVQQVPGAMWFLGTGNPDKDTQRPLHNSSFDLDEDALKVGVAMQTALAYQYLTVESK